MVATLSNNFHIWGFQVHVGYVPCQSLRLPPIRVHDIVLMHTSSIVHTLYRMYTCQQIYVHTTQNATYGTFRKKLSSVCTGVDWLTYRPNGDWSIAWPAVLSQGWPPVLTGNISCLSMTNRAHFASGGQWWLKLALPLRVHHLPST